jgi:DNA-binding transcriptional LysR family regulator
MISRVQAAGGAPGDDIMRAGALPPFAALRAFEAVGRLGGVRTAAQALCLDHAVISRHIRSLETWIGCKLVERRGGAQRLTDDGERYLERLSGAIGEIANATREVMHRDSDQRLTVWCAPGLASLWLTDRLLEFQQANPHLELELRPTDAGPDFGRYEADVDIRYRTADAAALSDGLKTVEIARPPVIPVASRCCIASLASLQGPADLLRAPLLHEQSFGQWQWWFALHGIDASGRLSGPRLWHDHLTVEAARRGRGVALANPFILGDDLASGRLVSVLRRPEPPAALGAYVLTARQDCWQRPAIVRFRMWLLREAACQLAEIAA